MGVMHYDVIHYEIIDCSMFYIGLNWCIMVMIVQPPQATVTAAEQSDEKQCQFQYDIAPFKPEMLVFCDESATNQHTARRPKGWAPEGERAQCRDFFLKKEK
jgi:hypothetical protein